MSKEELIAIAIDARKLSYSPYSKFAVGAAIKCKDGSIYVGANVENASYSLCMCAERNAIYSAMMDGKTCDDFESMAIVADTENVCSPCGACRQVLSELFPHDAPIYLANLHGDSMEATVDMLLPFAFSGEDL
ncbi:MAG: cytidine deaminase [Bacilli bacterium]|nr:cytidine deaminase [Bacilli bacterium]